MDSLKQNAPTVQWASLWSFWEGQRVDASFAPKKNAFFWSADFWFFRRFFCSCHPLSSLSFGDHHFFPSRLNHRAPAPTRLGAHLPHPCSPAPLCTLLVHIARCLPPQNPSLHLAHSFFCSLQALELIVAPGQWKGLSRCVCFYRCLLIPTIRHPNYNFSNTSFFFRLCSVKRTLLLSPPFLGAGSKSPKQS
jgi:hypothetical protein